MKYIIILGEEYWFKNEDLDEATFLLEYLETNRDKKKYN